MVETEFNVAHVTLINQLLYGEKTCISVDTGYTVVEKRPKDLDHPMV